MPELHGREHIAVQYWMEELRRGNKELLTAFDNGFLSVDVPELLPRQEASEQNSFTEDEQNHFW